MKVVVRVDASTEIGSGHVVRCLTLASSLRDSGADVQFVCRGHPGDLCLLVRSERFKLLQLPRSEAREGLGDLPHSHWLGVTQGQDARETKAALGKGARCDWLIVDHYALDADWERAMRPFAGRVMAIDDIADREHDCDLLLDQNLVGEMLTRYVGKVPQSCHLLLGPEYALLHPAYATLHARISPKSGPIERMLIYFGSADSHNVTGRALAAFLGMDLQNIRVDVVVPTASLHAESIRQQAKGHANVQVHSDLPTLADLIASADLALGGGGVTHWERLCLGLPSLVVTVAENQRYVTENLQSEGLVQWIGHWDEVDVAAISVALSKAIGLQSRGEWSRRCLQVCDGRGTDRVLEHLFAPNPPGAEH